MLNEQESNSKFPTLFAFANLLKSGHPVSIDQCLELGILEVDDVLSDHSYIPTETPEEGSKHRPRMDFGAIFEPVVYDEADAIADLHFDVKSLEASTDARLAALVSQADDTEYSVAALQFNVERLEGTVNTLNDILDNDSTQVIRITTRRYRVSEFLRFMGSALLGFAAVLTIGATVSDGSQKNEYAQLAVFAGLGAVLGMAIGYSTSEN